MKCVLLAFSYVMCFEKEKRAKYCCQIGWDVKWDMKWSLVISVVAGQLSEFIAYNCII